MAPEGRTDCCFILDAILDESLIDLDINIPFTYSRSSFSQLMCVIAFRCPKLSTLTITFFEKKAGSIKLTRRAPIKRISHLGSPLECLTSLRLFSPGHQPPTYPYNLESVLGIIGQTCPKLENLDMGDFRRKKKRSILALLLGPTLICDLFPLADEGWTRESVLYKLRIPTKYLNACCFTLKTLTPMQVPRYGSEHAFALRHLPKIQSWDPDSRSAGAIPVRLIKAIHKAEEKPLHPDQQAAFEDACRASTIALARRQAPVTSSFSRNVQLELNLKVAAASTLLSGNGAYCFDNIVVITFLYTLAGPLSIETISNVPVRDGNALAAVGFLCPHLTSIGFEDDKNPDDYVANDVTSVYRTMFKDRWSTVWRIIFSKYIIKSSIFFKRRLTNRPT